ADIVCIPSLQEGQGIVALEAQACGAPVVATRAGGLAEAVCDRLTGILVPPGRVAPLADALLELAGNAPLRRKYGRTAAAGARRLSSGTAPGPLASQTASDFQAAVAAFRPDVVHFHNIWLLGPAIVNLAPGRKGLTLHDYWPICLRRTMIRVNRQPCPGPEPL